MIGRITGILLEKKAPFALIDVHGIGYEVQVPLSSLISLGLINSTVTLHTHFIVREDAQLLFGFVKEEERRLFRDLIKVNGVGPKLGMTILSSMDVKIFIKSVLEDDIAGLIKLPGVGRKTAERLVIEMRDKFKDGWSDLVFEVSNSLGFGREGKFDVTAPSVRNDAIEALQNLGYSLKEATVAVNKVKEELALEGLIRRALQNLAMV